MLAYLQAAIISQALIFVTRSHGLFFMERPSYALIGAFAVAQLVSSVGGFGGKVRVKEEELKKFGSALAKKAGQTLARRPS